jgi:hypothetical protein
MNDDDDRVDGAAVSASLDALLARWRRNIEMDLRVAMPARVISYNPATQKATVRGEVLPVRKVEDEDVPDPPIVFPEIPVRWRRSMGGLAYDTDPLLPGDTGHVTFTDRALSVWLQQGNPGTAIDPVSGRTHDLGDAFFEPGLHTDTDPIVPPTSQTARVIEAPLIKLGVGGVEFALRGTALLATSATLSATLTAVPEATDPVTTMALANANTAAILGLFAALASSVSTKVQIQ